MRVDGRQWAANADPQKSNQEVVLGRADDRHFTFPAAVGHRGTADGHRRNSSNRGDALQGQSIIQCQIAGRFPKQRRCAACCLIAAWHHNEQMGPELREFAGHIAPCPLAERCEDDHRCHPDPHRE